MRKKLPIGIDGFEKIRSNDFYYIDKTMFIKELLQNWGEVNLFTRPRRFGKSLNISMLKSFFEIGNDPTLFKGLKIAEERELAIEAVFPQTEIQQCIIHQIRNTTKFVSYKEIKPLMADLKRVYAAPTEEIALAELDSFDDKWSGKYPKIAKSWKDNWANLSTYFKYPEAVRRLIYTTNAIEGFNRQLRKVTKSKTVFPSDESLLKMLYLAMMDITKNGQGTDRIGGRSIRSWRFSLKKGYPDYKQFPV